MVVVSREIVQTVHKMERLGVCESLAQFFYAAMDVAHVHVDFLDFLTVDCSAETEHAMRGRMLGADVHHEILGLEHAHVLFCKCAVGIARIGGCEVALPLAFDAYRVQVGVGIVVFAERISFPVDAKEQAAHVGIADEDNSEEVVDFALIKSSDFPYVGY